MTLLLALAVASTALYFLSSALAETRQQHRTIGHGLVKFKGKGPEAWYAKWKLEHKLHLRSQRQAQSTLRNVVHSERYGSHWLERAFMCIHAGEGSWTSNTGNGYYGGLQMDSSFQRSYGREYLELGTADRWPISVQLAVAIKAYLSGRGFYPWPNTARACGLIG